MLAIQIATLLFLGVQGLPESSASESTGPTSTAQQDPAKATGLPAGLTAQDLQDAFPARDPLNATNWWGTSLFGWKCVFSTSLEIAEETDLATVAAMTETVPGKKRSRRLTAM